MKQIKILISHTDKNIKKEIRESIKNIAYVNIVDEVTIGKEILDGILKYEPEIVFMKYDIKDMRVLDLVQMTERVLQEKAPIFKFISNDLNTTKKGIYEKEERRI